MPRRSSIASRCWRRCGPLLEDAAIGKVGHNLKYDAHVLANAGIALAGMRFDSMLESYVWNSVATNHDLGSDAQRYLGLATIAYEDVTGRGARQIGFDQVAVEKAAEYAAEDADMTLRLHGALWPQLQGVPPLARLYLECEQPLLPVLLAMERHGVLVDRERLRTQSREFARQLQELLLQAHREAGHEFNIDSPKQLQQILFERLQLPVRRRTPTGQPSTAEDVLEELAEGYALPRIVLEYRALAKLKSTYTDKLPELVNERTGRIHTNYAQAVAATGRLSSLDPNLQNIPVRRAEGRRIRQAFIAAAGQRADRRGLLADRAAHHGAPVRGRESARRFRRGPRRAPGDRRGSVRRGARRRSPPNSAAPPRSSTSA